MNTSNRGNVGNLISKSYEQKVGLCENEKIQTLRVIYMQECMENTAVFSETSLKNSAAIVGGGKKKTFKKINLAGVRPYS